MGQTLSEPVVTKAHESGQNGKFHYAMAEMQGWRLSMEDSHAAVLDLDGDTDDSNAFFAVYDGHGGSKVAKFACVNVHKRLLADETYRGKQFEAALKKAFLGTDEDMLADTVIARDSSGCTAVAALVTKDKIYVANAGDSRSVLSVKGEVKPLSFDHKPTSDVERARITKAGGFIEYGRVNGNLALSRALGDFEFKKNYSLIPQEQIITCDPDVTEHDITNEDEFIVIACDGIWDCLSSQDVVNFVRLQVSQGKELTEICENICDHCLAPDTSSGAGIGCDNMTIMIIAMLNGRSKEEWASWITDRVKNNHGYQTPETIPGLYSESRLAAFRARRAKRKESRESEEPLWVTNQRNMGEGTEEGKDGLLSHLGASLIIPGDGKLMFGEDNSDSDDSTEDAGERGLYGHSVTIGQGQSSLSSNLKERIAALLSGEDDQELEYPQIVPPPEDVTPVPGSPSPPPSAVEQKLPNGDVSKPVAPVEQLKPLPGGDQASPVVEMEGLMDTSESPLK